MHDLVARERFGRVALVGSTESAVRDAERRLGISLAERAGAAAISTRIVAVCAAGAAEAASADDAAGLLAALGAAVAPVAEEVDAVLLAQYSLSGVHQELQALVGVPVLSPPHLAAAALCAALG